MRVYNLNDLTVVLALLGSRIAYRQRHGVKKWQSPHATEETAEKQRRILPHVFEAESVTYGFRWGQ